MAELDYYNFHARHATHSLLSEFDPLCLIFTVLACWNELIVGFRFQSFDIVEILNPK